MSSPSLRAEHDVVLSSLATRQSTLHFAHSAVSGLLTIALAGTAGKLWWDWSTIHPEWFLCCIAVACLVAAYSLVHLALGSRANGKERIQLKRLVELRKSLELDGPVVS